MPKEYPLATVSGVFGAYYAILPDAHTSPILAKLAGKLRLAKKNRYQGKRSNPIVVGDKVKYDFYDKHKRDNYAVITDVMEQKNNFVRADGKRHHIIAANLDFSLIVLSIKDPRFNPLFLDRTLVETENAGIPVAIIFNKHDLFSSLSPAAQKNIAEYESIYKSIGYPVFKESFTTGISAPLRSILSGSRTLLMGQSGVGKSTFLNAVAKKALAQTALLNSFNKGMHTTTNPTLYRIDSSTQIVDIPGIKEYGLRHLSLAQLANGFREFANRDCHFDNCTHTHEPNCAVKAALIEGSINQLRYNSYLAIVESADEKYKPRKGDFWRGQKSL